MVPIDRTATESYATGIVDAIVAGTDKEVVESSLAKIYSKLGLSAPTVVWCEDMFQFSSFPMVLSSSAEVKAPVFSLGRNATMSRFYERLAELDGIGPVGQKLNGALTRLLADASQNLTMAGNRAVGTNNMSMIEECLDQQLGEYSNWSMDSSMELTRAQCELRAKLPGSDQLATELIIGDAWAVWDLRWLAVHACAGLFTDSPMYRAEADRTMLADWVCLMKGGKAFLFFKNVCFVLQHPVAAEESTGKGRYVATTVAIEKQPPMRRAELRLAGAWLRKAHSFIARRFQNGLTEAHAC